MKRWQWIVIAAFALLDLAVIGLLGYTVARELRRPPPRYDRQAIACARDLARALPQAAAVAVTREGEQITLRLELGQVAPARVAESPQALWLALDALARAELEACLAAPTIQIVVVVHEDGVLVQHVARFERESLLAWLDGAIDDAELADQALYRALRR